MDEVDLRYKDNIRDALQTGNVERLTTLIPGMSEERAKQCITEWKDNYLQTMQKIRNGEDTRKLDDASTNMLYSLLDEAHLSGYHK